MEILSMQIKKKNPLLKYQLNQNTFDLYFISWFCLNPTRYVCESIYFITGHVFSLRNLQRRETVIGVPRQRMWVSVDCRLQVYHDVVQHNLGRVSISTDCPRLQRLHQKKIYDARLFRNPRGGVSWWYSDNSNIHDTADLYIMKYLILVNVQVM